MRKEEYPLDVDFYLNYHYYLYCILVDIEKEA